MDFHLFCKRPSQNFLEFSKVHRLDEAEAMVDHPRTIPDSKSSLVPSQSAVISNLSKFSSNSELIFCIL